MTIEDVKLIKAQTNFRSNYFVKGIKQIEKENKQTDKAIQPDYQKMYRRIDNINSSEIFY
jgi:hypothetical protein